MTTVLEEICKFVHFFHGNEAEKNVASGAVLTASRASSSAAIRTGPLVSS